MSENLRNYTAALYGFEHVLKMTPRKAYRMKSPCEGWKGADVITHAMFGTTAALRFATNKPAPKSAPKLADDVVVQWEKLRAKTLAALDEPGVLHTEINGWFGPQQVDDFIGIMTADLVIHQWDLARTAKVDDRLDPALAAAALRTWKRFPDEMLRQPGVLGPALTPPKGADAQTKLLCFTGRHQ